MVKQIFFQKTKLIKVEKNGQTRDKKIGKFCIKKQDIGEGQQFRKRQI